MKTSFTFLIIAVLFITGCKKDSSNNSSNPPKTYLSSILTYSSVPAGLSFTEVYTYDIQNRVIVFNTGGIIFKYTYDTNNNLLKVLTYNSSGTLTGTDNYTYSGDSINVNTFYGDGSSNSFYTFTVNAQQQVVNWSADNVQYTYDSNGNVISYTACCTIAQSDSYTYDNKKNSLSMIGAKNLHMIYVAQGGPVTLVNNVLVDSAYPNNYSYTYNTDGFPLSATISNSIRGTTANITYTYITK